MARLVAICCNVGMWSHIDALVGCKGGGAEVVKKDEGPHHLQIVVGENAPNLKTTQIFSVRGDRVLNVGSHDRFCHSL